MAILPASCVNAVSIVVDVSQPSGPSFNDFGDGTGQTFTPTINGYLEGVSLYITKGGSGADTTLTIYTLTSGASGLKDIVGTASLLKGGLPVSGGWAYFDLVSPVTQTAGTPLAFSVSTPTSGATGYNNYWYSSTNPYSGGSLFSSGFRVSPSTDFAFTTHVSPIPEPSSLMVLGLGFVGFLARRFRRAEQVVTHQPAISFSISFQYPFNRAGGRTSNVRYRNIPMPMPGVKAESFPGIAERLGVTIPHVWDLASQDDEVSSTLSIRQVHKLSLVTGLGFDALIGFDADDSSDPITVDDFCTAIRTRISAAYSGISEFEEVIGWRVEEFLHDPDRLYDVANWDFLRDLASSVGIDPVAVLPHETQQANKPCDATGDNVPL